MSEYVVSDEQLEQISFDGYMDGANDEFRYEIDKSSFEEVIRCCDCKHYYENRPVVSADDCRCRNPMWMNGGLWSIQVSPDGFCAWGKER